MKPQIQANPHEENKALRRNALIFAVLTLITHIIACFMYGFFFVVPSQVTASIFYPIFTAFAHGLLVVVGFGLLFSYLKKMIWTGMGFTLLITALAIEFYFMLNAFWIKADVLDQSATFFADDDKTYNLYLTNQNALNLYMATITGGFRCALAVNVAFSSILGRAGPLEAWVVVFIGTIGYELNRQIIENWAQDSGASNSIFVFGGFMGLVIGIMRKIKQKAPNNTGRHENYTANNVSATMALIGTLFVWIFFPILTFDYVNPTIAVHTPYTSAYTVMYSLAAATVMSFATSSLLNGGLMIRDIIYGPIAGGVISSSAAYYVTNPVYGILIGMIGGTVQVIIMNVVQKKFARSKDVFHTFSFALFGVQGMLGAVFAGAWNAISRSTTNGFSYNYVNEEHQVFSWVISLISMPMGICFGALAGVICLVLASHTRQDHFNDMTYWKQDDGIRFSSKELAFKQGSNVKRRFDYL